MSAMQQALLGGGPSTIQRAIAILTSAGPGAWYDPSDLTTLFQDSAGTTPVTAVEQPVGLILDKSQGLVLGAELVPTLDFATWLSTAVTVKSGSSFTAVGSGGCWLAVPGWSATKSYRLVISGTCTTAWNLRNADNSLNTISMSSGAFSLNVPMTLLLQNSSGNLYFQPTGAATFTVTSISLKELPGNHLIQPTVTSRPTLKQDANGMYHIHFDGIDDSLYSAASVDFTSTDKLCVFAGVHKASDAAAGILVESSSAPNSTAGTFTVQAPVGAGLASFGIWSAGTTQRGADVSGATYAAPSTRVLTGVGDISGDLVVLRLNGAQVASAATDQGTGNYGNHVLYVGRRNNASFPFSGRIYQLAIKGKALSAGEVSTVESFVNSRTKAFV